MKENEHEKKFNFFEEELNKVIIKGKPITIREISKLKFLDDNFESRINFNNISKCNIIKLHYGF